MNAMHCWLAIRSVYTAALFKIMRVIAKLEITVWHCPGMIYIQCILLYPNPTYPNARFIRICMYRHVITMCVFFACVVVMAAATGKRKRVVLSLENKIVILDRLAKGERATKLATEFGIGNATIIDLKKNEDKIRSFMSSMESLSVSSKQRKIMRLAED